MLRQRSHRRASIGSALLVVVVTIAVVAILATAALPVVSGYHDLKNAADTYTIFQSLQYSLVNTSATIGNDGWNSSIGGNRLPSRLSYLNQLITTSSVKCQGGNFNAGDVKNAREGGPYSGLYIEPGSGIGSGLVTPVGTIKDTVLGNSAIPGTGTNRIAIAMDSVSDNDRNNLDYLIDASDGSTLGTFRWKASVGGAGYNYVVFTIAVGGCA